MNEINVIHPYKHEGSWVFDDKRVGLDKEPFVSGADTLIDRAVALLPKATERFTLVFSQNKFPSSHLKLDWRREDLGGNWYYSPDFKAEGWLCPALFHYFDKAPKQIHIEIRP